MPVYQNIIWVAHHMVSRIPNSEFSRILYPIIPFWWKNKKKNKETRLILIGCIINFWKLRIGNSWNYLVSSSIIRVITNQWYYCRRCPPAARSLCSIPGSITRPKKYAQQLSARWPQKKICLPGQAANDLAKTRAYPNSRPPFYYYSKQNAAGYVSSAQC